MSFPGTYPDRRRPMPADGAPTVGRLVHVYLPGIDGPLTAAVTRVLDDWRVLLSPFFPSQTPAFYPGAGTTPTPYSPTPKAGCWTWPAHTKETPRMTETPADKIDTTGAPEVTAMRPALNKTTTNIVVDPAALAAEDDAEGDPEKAMLQEKVDDARALAVAMNGRLREAEADNRMLHRRAVDVHLIADDVAGCAERTANADMFAGRVWIVAVIALLLSSIAGALGWQVVDAILTLLGWGALGVMVGVIVKYTGERKRLLRRLGALRAELSGPAL